MEVSKTFRNSPKFLAYFIKKRMQEICLLVDARMILKWAVHSVKVTCAKLQKSG